MSEGWVLFLLGIVLSIPIGVLTPFLTTQLQQKLGERTKRTAPQRRRSLEREMAEVSSYRNDFPKLVTFLLGRLLVITLASTVVAIVPALISMIGSILTAMSYDPLDYAASTSAYALSNYVYAASYIVSVLGFGVVIQLCVRTLRTYNKVNEYDKYIESWRDQIARLRGATTTDADSKGSRMTHQDRPSEAVPQQRDRQSGSRPGHHIPAQEPTVPSWGATPYGRPNPDRRP